MLHTTRMAVFAAAALLLPGCESAPGATHATASGSATSKAPASASAAPSAGAKPEASGSAASEVVKDDCDRLFDHWVKVLFAEHDKDWTDADKQRMREQAKSDGNSIAAVCRRTKFSSDELACMFKSETVAGIITCQKPRN